MSDKHGSRTTLGWVITGAWVIVVAVLLYGHWCSGEDMTLNEWGDFFAGVSAPLAFLWLVLGYFQQGVELRQNTDALKKQEKALQLQVSELKASVEQQSQLVDLTRQDVEASRSSLARSLNKQKMDAQPVFRVIGGNTTKNQRMNRIFQNIEIENSGHIVTHVSVTDIESGLEVQETVIGNWPPGVAQRIRVAFATGVEEGSTFSFALHYIDGLGEKEKKSFVATVNRGGSLDLAEEVGEAGATAA